MTVLCNSIYLVLVFDNAQWIHLNTYCVNTSSSMIKYLASNMFLLLRETAVHFDDIISKSVVCSLSVCSQPYQCLGLLLIFVIVELVPSQNKPATVPSLDKSSLLPEPPTPDDTGSSLPLDLCAGLTSTALGTAVGHTRLVHCSNYNLKKGKEKVYYYLQKQFQAGKG